MARKVFLEIKIGDIASYEDALKRYNSAKAWVRQWYSTYGFASDDLDQLGAEEKETLNDILSSDPTASSEKWIVDEPAPLAGGQVIIELNDKECPKTSENFIQLCVGGKIGKSSKKPLHYKDTRMFRLVNDFMVQGGDVTRGKLSYVSKYVITIYLNTHYTKVTDLVVTVSTMANSTMKNLDLIRNFMQLG